MSTRQERRRQERLAKKKEKLFDKDGNELETRQWATGIGKEKTYEMKIEMIQPWSVPVFKTTLPPDVLQAMIEISDHILADKDAESHGGNLAGQIEKELRVDHKMLEETGVMGFFMGAVRQFVIHCKCQMMPDKVDDIQREEWYTQMLTMWIISQQPGEYNPMHIHTQCTISAVMYLKVPKMLPSRKEHRPGDDGSILFVSNAARDVDFSNPNITFFPSVGDFFMFGAQQQHTVYPFRCEEGDPERRSISFNAIFQSKSDHDRGKEANVPGAVIKPGDSRPS